VLKHLFLPMHISGAREYLLQFFAIPGLAVLIILEIALSHFHDLKYYSIKETISNVFLALCNFSVDVSIRFFCFFVLGFFYEYHFLVITPDFLYWLILFLGMDLAFYWQHRVDHYSRFFWAVHVTHHSSTEFNITTGFRSSVLQPLYRYFYFIPLALLGFKAIDVMFIYACCQVYGNIIHTRYIRKLGFLELFMTTPSHHRVHHASNIRYLDKNMGMVLIIWDKIFGTFELEDDDEEIVYGLTHNPERRYHPAVMIFHEWKGIFADLRRPLPWKTRLAYVFMPPGWSHDGSTKTSRELQAELFKQDELRIAKDAPVFPVTYGASHRGAGMVQRDLPVTAGSSSSNAS